MSNQEKNLKQLIGKEKLSALAEEVKNIGGLLQELVKFADDHFMPKVKGFQGYYTETKTLCDNLNRVAETLLKAEAASKLGLTYSSCSEACSNHFNELVRNFQFHDIIQQKVNHLQEVNSSMVVELEASLNGAAFAAAYLAVLNEVLEFYQAQLALIKTEYTLSFQEIRKQLNHIRDAVERVEIAIWEGAETAFFSEKDIIDLPEHIFKSQELAAELAQGIKEMEQDADFMNNLAILDKQLKKMLPVASLFHGWWSHTEKEEAIKKINKVFTMESERQLWHKVIGAAGLAIIPDTEQEQEEEDSGIDLF